MMFVYRCRDELDNIFTAIYKVYEDRANGGDVLLSLDGEAYLFAKEREVETDRTRSEKVARSLRARFGEEDYERICLALTSPDPGKAQVVYHVVERGIATDRKRGHLFDDLGDQEICKAFKLSRNAGRELGHLEGFLRFQELKSGILYARITPHNRLIEFLMEHFSDRFPQENFLIHDVPRGLVGVHPCRTETNMGDVRAERSANEARAEGNPWFVAGGEMLTERLRLAEDDISGDEREYQELFKEFCRSITIDERRNPGLQRQMLPLHFREYMPEFH